MQPVITVFCPFTRTWAIERWIGNLTDQNYDKSLINLVFIIDCDEPSISYKLNKMANDFAYRSIKLAMNVDNNPNEARISIRRQRIVDVREQSKAMIAKTDGLYVIGLEDDTVFPPDTITKLLLPLLTSQKVGFVEGVQCGRWGVKMIGAWKSDNPKDPTYIETLLPKQGLEQIDGGGLYGYATLRHSYLEANIGWNGEVWGPDVNYGLWLRNQGYDVLIDWSLIFQHNDFNQLLDPTVDLSQICYTKDIITNTWSRYDIEGQFYGVNPL